MAGSLNRVTLIGNLGKDPEVRSMQDGTKIVNLTLATSETWKDKSGERVEKTEWHRIVIFNDRTADVAEKYTRKGSKVYIEGALQTRKWTDKDGTDKYSTEVVIGRFNGVLTLLDKRDGDAGDRPAAQPQRQAPRAAEPNPGRAGGYPQQGGGRDLDNEIPF